MADAFGTMLIDAIEGRTTGHEIVERDDGFIAVSTFDYLAPVRRWKAVERRALRYARSRVLDVGCGAGRAAMELQARGREVVAIDPSPGAVEVARRRGVQDVRLMRLEDVDESLGHFGTMLMYGNNLGLFASRSKARRLLRRLRPLADRIVAGSNDVSGTDDPVHLAYQERNLKGTQTLDRDLEQQVPLLVDKPAQHGARSNAPLLGRRKEPDQVQ